MDKKLTKQEALNLIDQLILPKMKETGKSYMEISRVFMHNLNEKLKTNQKPPEK